MPCASDQADWLQSNFRFAIVNFDLAEHAVMMMSLRDENDNEVPFRVLIEFHGPPGSAPFGLESTYPGVFAIPVIQNAVVEARRLTEFFGFRVDGQGEIQILSPKDRRKDDIGISEFGLPTPSLAAFLTSDPRYTADQVKSAIQELVFWGHKQLAHYTKNQPHLPFQSILTCAKFFPTALKSFIFEPLGLPFPTVPQV